MSLATCQAMRITFDTPRRSTARAVLHYAIAVFTLLQAPALLAPFS
jgi:hypothetical protein